MSLSEEERELQEAMVTLKSQIDQQKELLNRLMDLKRKRIQKETDKAKELKIMISQQKKIEKREIKENNKITKPKHTGHIGSNVDHKQKEISAQLGKLSSLITTGGKTVNKTESIQNGQPLTKFTRKILANRRNYYYKNRKFFHGYKFVLTNDEKKLSIVSTAHELSGVPLQNANMLPVAITLTGKSYIKSAQGDYYLENLSKKYISTISLTFFRNFNINSNMKQHTNINSSLNLINRAKNELKAGTAPTDEPCIFYTKTGNCTNVTCRFKHITGRVSLCPTLQSTKHKCLNKICHYSHEPSQFNSPSCIYFQENNCNNDNCIFTHKKENKFAPICREFSCLGYCSEGFKCKFTHSFECPDLKEYGRCLRGQACTCLHNSNILGSMNNPEKNDNTIQNTEIRNKDNDSVVQIVYDDSNAFSNEETNKSNKGNNINRDDHMNDDYNLNNSDSDDDNVEFIVGPMGQGLGSNSDYVSL
ncbi:hypothetical protein C6P40_000961 [Pichia californica]|uniref:C3H1-type domain-containing protein n=1 Tax=Pichia californica TaxID=460514 RepID=A0A9P6WR04_9ASCO|nr:hypothetical protein C6P42_002328 [[Candida] californica]KAG0690877.1 hypothetical protein C6P40_000961 [[Candida] californica]